jgi:two-component system, OmpR family, alkaline phosphatase synthesis response regulator PhoP
VSDGIAAAYEVPERPTVGVLGQALVVGGGSDTTRAVSRALAEAGFEMEFAPSAAAALLRLRQGGFDLVVLEVTWSGAAGIDLIQRIRADGDEVPIIVVGAWDSEAELVVSLDLGADDYLATPVSTRELVSRSRAILRRVQRGPVEAGSLRTVGALRIDMARHEVFLGEREVDVTSSELRVLELLSSSPAKVFTRQQIMEHLWAGPYYGDGHPVDTHMLNLRRKLEDDPTRPSRLLTVRGAGFRLVAPADEILTKH